MLLICDDVASKIYEIRLEVKIVPQGIRLLNLIELDSY